MTGLRVDQAGHLLVGEGVIQARLIARDAGVDLLGAAGLRLGHPVRVGEHRAGHRDQLHAAGGQDVLGGLRHVDPVGRHHRDRDLLGDLRTHVDERAVGHRGDDGGHAGLMPAEPGVDQGGAGVLDLGGQRQDLLEGLAVLDVVGHRHPVAENEIVADRGAGAPHDLHREAPPLGGTSTPVVGASVGPRRQELVDQIALAAHDLHPVVTGLAGQPGAAHEVGDGGVHRLRRELARPKRRDRGFDRRGTHRQRVIGVAPGVQHLQQDLRAPVVDGGGDAAVPARLGAGDQLRPERQQPADSVGGVTAGDDHPDPTARPGGEILGEAVDVAGPVLQAGVHRPHHHPIAQRGEPQIQRGEQVRKIRLAAGGIGAGHTVSSAGWGAGAESSAAVTSSSQPIALSSARIPPRNTRYWCSGVPARSAGRGNWLASKPR